MRRLPLALAVMLGVAGCPRPAPPRVVHPRPFPGPIALLPLANGATNLQGPVLIRRLLETSLRGAAFTGPDPATVDDRLRALGVTDGGQLGSVSATRLAESLGVAGLLYGEVVTFNYTNLGFLARRSVEVRLRLVEAATGETVWQATRKETRSKAALSADAMKENFVVGLGTKLIETALKSPLRPESEVVSHALVRDLSRARNTW